MEAKHWGQLDGSSDTTVIVRGQYIASLILHDGKTSSSSNFDGGSGSQQFYPNLLFKIVPSVPDESTRFVNTLFHAKIKTLQVDLRQTDPYFEATILNSYL